MIRKINPVTEMIGYGPHNQPPGAWYDDSFMTLCLAECLCNGCDLEAIANFFLSLLFQWEGREVGGLYVKSVQ